MTIPFAVKPQGPIPSGPADTPGSDPRAVRILAKTIYRDLRQAGLAEQDVMCLAGELLSLVAGEMHERRNPGDT
jgi:hypothetical protein